MNRFAGVLAAALCSACGDESTAPSWQLVFEDLPGALISVAGTSENDVWVVGADDGESTTVLHYDGSAWTREESGLSGVDLWWSHPFSERSMMMGGSRGTVVHWQDGTFTPMTTPGTATVFGLWGVDENDVWAVGGEIESESSGFVWRYDGNDWSDVSAQLPSSLLDVVFFKVWGRSPTDVWLVGMEGAAVHWDGEAFTQGDPDTTRRLLTVHGAADGEPRFAAVGGFGGGVICEHDGEAWRDVTPSGTFPQLFGVSLSGEGNGYAVGVDGSVARRDSGGWQLEDTGISTDKSLHSVWIDPSGGVWAVGGDIIAPPLLDGLLIHKGSAVANDIE